MFDPSQDRPLAGSGRPPGPEDLTGSDPLLLHPGGQLRTLLSMLDAVEITVVDVLSHLADRVTELLPAVDGACVALAAGARRERVATARFAAAVEELEESLGEGPHLDAVARQRSVRSGELAQEARWPRLAAASRTQPVRSVLVLPLRTPAGPVGTLSAYAFAPDAFDDRTRQLGVRLATTAARTVRDALVLDRARRLTSDRYLSTAGRAAVDAAIEVLMRENGVAAEQAYGVLQLLGRTERDDLVTVARAIVAAGDTSGTTSPHSA